MATPRQATRTVTIQAPVLGVQHGVRAVLYGLCTTTGIQVPEAMMEAGIEKTCAARRGVIRLSGRRGAAKRGPSRDASRAPSRRAAAAGSACRRRGVTAELPMGRGRRSPGRPLAVGGRGRGLSAPRYAGTLGPGAGRGGGAGDVEQRTVSAVPGPVGQAPAVVSQPAVGRAGLGGGLHRRQVFRDHCVVVAFGTDTQGCKHVLGLREGVTETAAVARGSRDTV